MYKQNLILIIITTLLLSAGVNAQSGNIRFTNGAKLVKKTFSGKEKKYEMNAEYPQIVGIDSETASDFNRLVKLRAMKILEQFESVIDFQAEDVSNYYCEVFYVVEYANDDVISIRFTDIYYTGGAHPNSNTSTLTYGFNLEGVTEFERKGEYQFEREEENEFRLEDLFRKHFLYLAKISDESIRQLEKKLNSPKDDWIRSGAGPKPENFRSWNLTPKGLRINFDPYQVAPYVVGHQMVLIPYKEIRKFLENYDFEPFATATKDPVDPMSQCDTTIIEDYKLARVKGEKDERTYFHGVEGKEYSYPLDKPNAKKYRKKSYLLSGDEVLLLKFNKSWVCSWYQPKKGDGTLGLISLDKLSIVNNSAKPGKEKWMGNWAHSDVAYLRISKSKKRGFVKLWGQGEDVTRHGVVASWIEEVDIKPVGNRMTKNVGQVVTTGEEGDKYECLLKLRMLGKYLLAKDNDKCGVAHVTFTGIYRRTK